MDNEIIEELPRTRLVQIEDKFHCYFVEYVPSDLLDETRQIEITDEERLAIGITKCFDLETMQVVDYDNADDLEYEKYYNTYIELQSFLHETDYIASKLAEATAEYIVNGDSTEIIVLRTNYKEILEKRTEYRKIINDLQMELERLGGLDDN